MLVLCRFYAFFPCLEWGESCWSLGWFGHICIYYPVFVMCPEESGSIYSWSLGSYTIMLFNNCNGPDSRPPPPQITRIRMLQVGDSGIAIKWNPCLLQPSSVYSQAPIANYFVRVTTAAGDAVTGEMDVGLQLATSSFVGQQFGGHSMVATVTCVNAVGKSSTTRSPTFTMDSTSPIVSGMDVQSIPGTTLVWRVDTG